jgi:phospholipase A-2-activating protein
VSANEKAVSLNVHRYNTAKFEGILKKLAEFGAQVSPPLGAEGEAAMAEVAAAASGGGALSPAAAAALGNVLASWPVDKLFPALDLARMLVLRQGAARCVFY